MLCLFKRPKAPAEGSFPRKNGRGCSLPPLDDFGMKLLLVQGPDSTTLWSPLGGFGLYL